MEKCRMSALTDIFFPDLPRQFAAVKPDPSEAAIDAHFDALDAVIARIRAQMVADGLIREPGCRTRDGEAEIGRATSELQSLMRISYAVFCLKKKPTTQE